MQLLHVTATSGTYELEFHIAGVPVITAPIAYNASAEQVRQTIQNAVAAVESSDPNVQAFLVDKLDVWVSQYPSAYLNEDVYVLNFQGELRKEQFGPGVDTVAVVASTLNVGGTATITTRMDGIDYYGFEQVNIGTGSGSDVFNVEGTTQGSNGFVLGGGVAGLTVAQTNISLNNGDDRVYLSSNANLDQSSWNGFDFLTGNLDDFRGALNIDLGAGRQRLFISDEGSTHPDTYAITRSIADTHNYGTASLAASADIYLTRAGLPGITYTTSGNLFDGVNYWTGSGADTIYDRRHEARRRPARRRRSSTPASATTTSRSTSRPSVTGSSSSRPRAARRRATRCRISSRRSPPTTTRSTPPPRPCRSSSSAATATTRSAAARATTSSSGTSGSCSTRRGRVPTRCWRSSASAAAAT